MAMRRNQPKLQAKDLPVSGVTNSASFRPGEKSAISAAGICCSMGTAIARARKPAIRPSTANKRNRNSLRRGIAVDSNMRIPPRSAAFLWEDSPDIHEPKGLNEFPANDHIFLHHFRCRICRAHRLATRREDAAGSDSAK